METDPMPGSSPSLFSIANLSADELSALAERLADHADGIVNVAAHDMEQDIRLAATALRQVHHQEVHHQEAHHQEAPPPLALLPALHQEIERTAASCSDAIAAGRLRKLIGVDG
jgi:hypothetical protein